MYISRRIKAAVLILLAASITATECEAHNADAPVLSEFQLRELGPALKPGRVADIAVDPNNDSVWYLAMASSGLWKTTNRGTSWEPIFDEYGAYSLGCITIDPKNSDVLWLGTGENQASRSASFGDGIYKSTDGGASWTKMGLPRSEHIAKILVDPRDSDVVLVASQGPLWSAGGDRGLYKTTDGGETWELILEIGEHTGITDVVADPRNFDRLYAASYQRRRNVGLLIGGGPEAAIFKSDDGGTHWRKLENGLPTGDLGRIALAISPQDPDIVYALIVASGEESGFFRSADRGETWTRQSNYRVVDPQYYGELYADPHHFERLYAVDVRMHVTDDGGRTFNPLSWSIHVDQHAITFDRTNPAHLLVGNDGGLYETYDDGQTWRHFTNLPSAQFYHLAVDNAEPFYNVYGGTQDNGSQGGPSRTINAVGIRTSDWVSVGGGDGMQPRIDPTNPNIVFTMSQHGAISRLNLATGESTGIRPEVNDDDPDVRWNWNCPFIISPHNSKRLYLAGSRLFRSDDAGDIWKSISPDLTRQLDRDSIPIMGRLWGHDAITKNLFTTDLGVCSAMSESPDVEGMLLLGTNDGLLQLTKDGGDSWTRMDGISGVPDYTPVSDVVVSHHDSNRFYVALENHERGDFRPYLYKTEDAGKSWSSIGSTLPARNFVWSIAEDPVNEQLLFVGTEFGLFASIDRGRTWLSIKNGAPTIAFRDLVIQNRVVDLVGATFGRGFFVLDDFTALRHMSPATLDREATLYPIRQTYVYRESRFVTATANDLAKSNAPVGAAITYSLKAALPEKQSIAILVRNEQGEMVRELTGPATAGIHRVHWDLRKAPPIDEQVDGEQPRRRRGRRRIGEIVPPGNYMVELHRAAGDQTTSLDQPQQLRLVPLQEAGDNSAAREVATGEQQGERQEAEVDQTAPPVDGHPRVYNARIEPHWLPSNTHFWYRNQLPSGKAEFVLVDAKQGKRKPAFDHAKLAAALSKAAGSEIDASRLPFDAIDLSESGFVRFVVDDKAWQSDLDDYSCVEVEFTKELRELTRPPRREGRRRRFSERQSRRGDGNEFASPDGKKTIVIRDHNLIVKDVDSDDEVVLSTDGGKSNPYQRVAWSPDSKRIAAFRVEPGDHKPVYRISSSPDEGGRAVLQSNSYDLPGDKLDTYELNLFEIESQQHLRPDVERIDFGRPRVRWSLDGKKLSYEKVDRGHQRFRVIEVDATTGDARALIDESSDTFINTTYGGRFLEYLDDSNEIVHLSERDGWQHLYLIDTEEGKVKNQITSGEWVVRGVDLVDADKRQIWFRASGFYEDQDPYFIHYFRVNFDGTELTPLTSENGNHSANFSPDRSYLVDTYSRVDTPPVHELRSASTGKLICRLEAADASELLASGWQSPRVFVAKGRDHQTNIWGIVCLPRDFDPTRKYPIIEDIYAGPQDSFVPKSFSSRDRYQSLTDLGFIVVKIDGMGTRNRSKAFHDVCFRNLKDAGFEDRKLWIKAAAGQYPQMDLSRVGIYGNSAGGQNAAAAVLFHPDFYHVAVASCGCHDNRMDKAIWNEQWMGYPVGPWYGESSNIDNAYRLEGQLLLIVGELDTNVPPESTFRFADALIDADKDFDLVVIPGGGHGMGEFGRQKMHDFFVEHLLGAKRVNRNSPQNN